MMKRNYRGSTDKSNGDTAVKVILLIVIIVIMAGACLYFLSDMIMQEKPPDSDPGAVSGPEHVPDPVPDPDPDPGDDHVPVPDPEPPFVPPDNTVINIADIRPELQAALDEEALAHNSAGVSLVVYDGYDDVFYTYQYGSANISAGRPVNADTKFRFASLSKTVVAVCAMKLVDDGKLDLDADISGYLGYEVKNPNYPDTAITTRMLLQHTSTIYDTAAFGESLSGVARVSTRNLLSRGTSYWDRRPGTAFAYTNFGYSILGAVIELASGKKLDTYAHEVLFDPLDIDASFLAVNITDTDNIATLYDTGHGIARSVSTMIENSRSGDLGEDQHIAQGGLIISAYDYAKILSMLGNGGIYKNKTILSPGAVSEMHKTETFIELTDFKQGLSTRFTHGGSPEDDSTEVIEDILMWQYFNFGDTDRQIKSDGFYWHTGHAYGVYAQYIYVAGSGTDEGIGGPFTSRGVVVVTTGASTGRATNGMVNACNHLSSIAWLGLGFDQRN